MIGKILGSAALLVACSSHEATEFVDRRTGALSADAGFEDASAWRVIAGSATVVDEGSSLRLANIGGSVELQNADPFVVPTADGALRLALDLPAVRSGHAGLYFDVPSRRIRRRYVGPVDLAGLPAGKNELAFVLPDEVRAALAGSNAVTLGIEIVVPAGTSVTLDDICFSNCGAGKPPSLWWTSRDVWDLQNIGWASHRNLTASELKEVYDQRAGEGMIPINLGAKRKLFDVEYSIVWRDNVDRREWKAHWDLTGEQYHTLWEQYRSQGFRPLGVTSYELVGRQVYAGIWIKNVENLGWASFRGLTSEEYANLFLDYRARRYRPIDIEMYATDDGPRIATIWWQNVDDVAWGELRDLSREQYQEQVDANLAAGYLMIDYDSYEAGDGEDEDEHAAIWERPVHWPAHTIRTNREDPHFANFWRQYRDEGYRPLHIENHGDGSDDQFGGIWIENSDRFHYARKGDLDSAIETYRITNDVPGISVAVIRANKVLYRRGFGFADVDGEKIAHGGTVYKAASVSKVIGGTLAAKLEAEGVLRDGTPVSLDMTLPTDNYLTSMPAHHTHTVEQLTAHLSCVAYYDSDPDINNQTTHYGTALAAVQSIWNVGLINGCMVGGTRQYSTAAFTFLGAVLEDVSGRNIHDLVRTEIAEPYGLQSLRSQWASSSLPDNYERAEPYKGDNNDETDYTDDSWKVLGGGIELDVVDLARFGALVLYAEIVSPSVRDNRLFAAVSPGCGMTVGGLCENGVAWKRTNDSNGRRAREHNGSATGARSFLRIYPDDDLVVAVLSNHEDHGPEALGELVGDIVLVP